jgi:hypothetical protein
MIMKKISAFTKESAFYSLLCLICYFSFFGCTSLMGKEKDKKVQDYTVAAYVWPSCHDEPMVREAFWSEGIGEWEMIKKGKPIFTGHYQPRIPLWGYKMDDDPLAWEQKINAATDHGVNAFIFDWYWFDGKPFLEKTVNEGFLKARNNSKMKFYFMWANHNAEGQDWNALRYKKDTIIWSGVVDWNNFKIIVDRLINQFFKQPNYFKINNEPVLSIYRIANLVKSFNGLEGTKEALDYFRKEVKKAGFPGLHIQLVGRGSKEPVLLDVYKDYTEGKSVNEIITTLGINSITTYNWINSGINEDYIKWAENAMYMQSKWDSILTIPYFPNVSMGRDDTPRRPNKKMQELVHIIIPLKVLVHTFKKREIISAIIRNNQNSLPYMHGTNGWKAVTSNQT